MNTVQKTDSATMETVVISQHISMNDAIDAAEIVAEATEDGSLVSVVDAEGNEVWTNEGDWRGAVRAAQGETTMNSNYPATIYATPVEWGSYTIYADQAGMEKQIESLKDAGGADWDGINLSECDKYALVSACNDGSAAYEPQHVRYNHDIYIMRSAEDPTYFEKVEVYHDEFNSEELTALGINRD